MVFKGQYNIHTARPDGIVRAIFPNGRIYEGNMNKDCAANGFGVLYGNHIKIGWWEDNEKNGNHMTIDITKNVYAE